MNLPMLGLAGGLMLLAAAATPPEKFPGSRITLPRAEMPLEEILAELRKSGNRVEYHSQRGEGPPNSLIKVPTASTPFWPLLDQLAWQEKLGLSVEGRSPGMEPRVRIRRLGRSGRMAAPPTAYSGPFRLVLREASRHRRFDQKIPAKLQLGFELSWEPRFDPLFLQVESLTATAGKDKLAASPAAGQLRLHGLGQFAWSEQLNLPALPPTQLDELSGILTIRVPTRSRLLTLEARRGATTEADGIRLEVLGLEPSGRSSLLRLELRYPAGQFELESHQAWAFADQPIELAASRDGPVLLGSDAPAEVSVLDGSAVRLHFLFQRELAALPTHLRLSVPAEPISYRFPFTFSGVSLP